MCIYCTIFVITEQYLCMFMQKSKMCWKVVRKSNKDELGKDKYVTHTYLDRYNVFSRGDNFDKRISLPGQGCTIHVA